MSVTFTCYFPAERPLFITVNIESDSWVNELLDAIHVKLKNKGQEDVSDLRLYKVTMFFLWYTPN